MGWFSKKKDAVAPGDQQRRPVDSAGSSAPTGGAPRAPAEQDKAAGAQTTPRSAASGGQRSAPQAPRPGQKSAMPGLTEVKHIVAVASGKGGVAKSTSAVNLGFALADEGYAVGILDADVYGPSVVKMTGVSGPTEMVDDRVVPPSVRGVSIISPAMFASAQQASILRGPMASNVVRQLLTQVAWGRLDYLIIDYPPGTGDIQLTLSQTVALSGAVLVTTPQEVALLDVRKAHAMFQTLKVRSLGVLETMAYFVCDQCDARHLIFGTEGGQRLANELGVPLLGQVPIDPALTQLGDEGLIPVIAQPNSLAAQAYRTAALELKDLLGQSEPEALESFSLTWKKLP